MIYSKIFKDEHGLNVYVSDRKDTKVINIETIKVFKSIPTIPMAEKVFTKVEMLKVWIDGPDEQ